MRAREEPSGAAPPSWDRVWPAQRPPTVPSCSRNAAASAASSCRSPTGCPYQFSTVSFSIRILVLSRVCRASLGRNSPPMCRLPRSPLHGSPSARLPPSKTACAPVSAVHRGSNSPICFSSGPNSSVDDRRTSSCTAMRVPSWTVSEAPDGSSCSTTVAVSSTSVADSSGPPRNIASTMASATIRRACANGSVTSPARASAAPDRSSSHDSPSRPAAMCAAISAIRRSVTYPTVDPSSALIETGSSR